MRARATSARSAAAAALATLAALSLLAPPASAARHVAIATAAFGCGAAPGLGCGLALQPVLEQLDALEGIARAEVTQDGSVIRLRLERGADPDRAGAQALAALPEGATVRRRLATPRWHDAASVVELSRREARVIAFDFAADMRDAGILDRAGERRVALLLLPEFEAAFERAHAAGGGVPRLWPEFPAVQAHLSRRLPVALGPDLASRVLAFLEEALSE